MTQQHVAQLVIETRGQGLYEFTREVEREVGKSGVETGMLVLFCRHTSCSLTIQENADPDVQRDLVSFFSRLVPENLDYFVHTLEGPDDMPAHVKAALTQVSLSIPIIDGKTVLGTWQGIYLFEHRRRPHRRQIVINVTGE
ncbi:MAG: secondary thiamine-phosphate synthase enzyme YjbQ [Hyphomicrobiaceae bacterium]|nr:secondary thiamine-phosphate synthase enzyme YjbQ [Hyphomicrobiaceae bacterium]MCC0023190.1 YjbQ family protein [Hyphomicrobiaceae bacterium]